MSQAILIFAQDEGRSIPRGRHGGCVHVRYRLMNGGTPAPNVTITERFSAVEDRHHLVPRILLGTYRTDSYGAFDDVVGFSCPDRLPSDFHLVADQEIFANGTTVARNRINWNSTRIMVRAIDGRLPLQASVSVALR